MISKERQALIDEIYTNSLGRFKKSYIRVRLDITSFTYFYYQKSRYFYNKKTHKFTEVVKDENGDNIEREVNIYE